MIQGEHYDYLLVGAGLFNGVFAHEMKKRGKTLLVIEKRDHIAGNIYTCERQGIQVHQYGAHIFHTSNKQIWDYMNEFAEFNHYINSPVAVYKDELYNLPFNMNTFHQLWGVKTPQQAKAVIQSQIDCLQIGEPSNLEEQALSLVGPDIYDKLIKGYTEKQWGKSCSELPAFIIRRLPLRFTYDNNYFKDPYQGIPIGGYTNIAGKMFEGVEVRTNTSYSKFMKEQEERRNGNEACVVFDKVIYTGMVDEYFNYCYGNLEYRSLEFEHEEMRECENYQGNAVVNYTDGEVPYTRVIEHKHFEFGKGEGTVVTREYPTAWSPGKESYYPVNDNKNNALLKKYQCLAEKEDNIIFGGRLGMYRYLDMDKVVEEALGLVKRELAQE